MNGECPCFEADYKLRPRKDQETLISVASETATQGPPSQLRNGP